MLQIEKGLSAAHRQAPKKRSTTVKVPNFLSYSKLAALKDRAKPYLADLAERAGFRPSRIKNKYHCNGHEDSNPSVHFYDWGLQCFCCGHSLDAISLAALAVSGTVSHGIRELERLTGADSFDHNITGRPRFTCEDLAQAQLFKTGLLWQLEETLESAKANFFEGTGKPNRIRELTDTLATSRRWSLNTAAEAYLSMLANHPNFAASLAQDARSLQQLIAGFLYRLGSKVQESQP